MYIELLVDMVKGYRLKEFITINSGVGWVVRWMYRFGFLLLLIVEYTDIWE